MRIYLSIYLYLQPYKVAHVYQFQHLHFRCTQLILCTNRRIRNVFVLNWACVHYELYLPMYCIVFAFVYFKLYARERERGSWGGGACMRSVAPIAVPFLLIHCCQVAHSTRAHVLLSKQISLELLNKLRWLGNLMDKHFACLLWLAAHYITCSTELSQTHTNTYNTYAIWLLKFVYIFIANNAAATGWREVSSCCALSRDRSTSCYL